VKLRVYHRPLAIAQNLVDAPLTGNELFRAIVVIFVAVRAFKGADVWVGNERICALARHDLAPLYSKALQAGFTFYEPDQSHLSANLTDRIFNSGPLVTGLLG
jgi:hypothetical protein